MKKKPNERIERQDITPPILICPEGRRPVRLVGEVLARGGEGSIQALAGEPPLVAKLYHAPSPERRAKVEAMLADPPRLAPLQRDKRQYLQLTWPVGVLEDLHGTFFGYAMPRLALERTVTLEALLNARARRAYGLPEEYRFRLKVAYQLAHLVAELHAHGHHIIDLKPQNLHVYRDAPYLALLDTDGFSIHGENRRYPAHVFTDGYIAPEALRQSLEPEQLDEAQDRFALAVILFQLLNHGLHPYQGVPAKGAELPNTNGERIKAGLYAYGRQSHPDIAPAPVSVHRHFDDPTRALFDRAFLPNAERPDAEGWSKHLAQLLDPAHSPLVPCPERPNDSHFDGACALCAAKSATRAAGKAHSQTPKPRRKRRTHTRGGRRPLAWLAALLLLIPLLGVGWGVTLLLGTVAAPFDRHAWFAAITTADLEHLRSELRRGASPDLASSDGWSSLELASRQQQVEVVRLLLEAGADVNDVGSSGDPPLLDAIHSHNLEIVQLIIEAEASQSETLMQNAVTEAVRRRDQVTLEFLLDHSLLSKQGEDAARAGLWSMGGLLTRLDADGIALPVQDGDYGEMPWSCVRDEISRLTWIVPNDSGELFDYRHRYRHPYYHDAECSRQVCDALNARLIARDANLCGIDDWRLPSPTELTTLAFRHRAGGFPHWPGFAIWGKDQGAPMLIWANGLFGQPGGGVLQFNDTANVLLVSGWRKAIPDNPVQRFDLITFSSE